MMGNDDILRFFKGGQSVEWINDSSCNVMFRDDDVRPLTYFPCIMMCALYNFV